MRKCILYPHISTRLDLLKIDKNYNSQTQFLLGQNKFIGLLWSLSALFYKNGFSLQADQRDEIETKKRVKKLTHRIPKHSRYTTSLKISLRRGLVLTRTRIKFQLIRVSIFFTVGGISRKNWIYPLKHFWRFFFFLCCCFIGKWFFIRVVNTRWNEHENQNVKGFPNDIIYDRELGQRLTFLQPLIKFKIGINNEFIRTRGGGGGG